MPQLLDAGRHEPRISSLPQAPAFSETFCSYCGYPPRGRWRERPHRVCRRCKLGVMLHTPAPDVPGHDDPFVILDERLTVQGVSRGAEAVLSVDEASCVDHSLAELLISANGDGDGATIARLAALAVAGNPPPDRLELRTADDPVLRFRARLAPCGPPAAALLLLTPVLGEGA